MKRIIICAAIMLTVIAIGIISLFYTNSVAEKAERTVDEISASFEDGEFNRVKRLTAELNKEWQDYYQGHIFMVDKEHALEITMAIARIQSMAQQDDDELPTECGTTAELIRLYRRKHEITLENIF